MKKFLLFFILTASLPVFIFSAENQQRPIVRDIKAEVVASNKVKVSWKISKNFNASSLVVYKSTEPIASKNQLYKIRPLGEVPPKAIAFTDTLTTYNDYYYAVIAKNSDGTLYDIVLPSINATANGVKAPRGEKKVEIVPEDPEKLYPAGTMREVPLPYLDMIDDLYKKPNKLDELVLLRGKELAKGHKAPAKIPLDPYYFEEDMIRAPAGDEYYLFEILKTTFVKKDYKNAATQLKTFLSVNRSEKVTDRAVFYLGQCQYYMHNYKQAVNLFLYTQDSYPSLSKKWIESCLDLYKIPE